MSNAMRKSINNSWKQSLFTEYLKDKAVINKPKIVTNKTKKNENNLYK